jgi:hypothetical protein
VDIQSAPTGADGSVSFQAAPPTTGKWRVVVPPIDARTEGVSTAFTTQVLSLVTASPKNPRVPRGKKVVVKSWARPAVKGQTLALQIQRGAKWKNVVTKKANANGRARLKGTVPKARGKYTYRVVAVGKGGILSNASTEFPVRVTKK